MSLICEIQLGTHARKQDRETWYKARGKREKVESYINKSRAPVKPEGDLDDVLKRAPEPAFNEGF